MTAGPADRLDAFETVDSIGAFVGTPRVLAVGAASGALAGVTLAVKDLYDVAGTVTGAGNPSFAERRAPATIHAEAVARLVAAGATVVGKTITDELAYSLSGTNVHFGTPRNVAAPGRVPGGSSAGSAAAVAAGLVDLALGTDTGGSIRVPASYCGIIGWRPTHGAVPLTGVVPLAPSFDTAGLFARDPDLLMRGVGALLSEPISGDDDGQPVSGYVLIEECLDQLSPACRASIVAAASTVGATESAVLGCDLDAAVTAFRTLQGYEAWQTHGAWIEATQPAMGPGISARFAVASKVTIDDVRRAEPIRERVRALIAAATAGGRVLVAATTAGAAPLVHPTDASRAGHEAARSQTLRLTCLAGLAGAPVIVRPLASDGGLPFGLAFMGEPGSDRQLMSVLRA